MPCCLLFAFAALYLADEDERATSAEVSKTSIRSQTESTNSNQSTQHQGAYMTQQETQGATTGPEPDSACVLSVCLSSDETRCGSGLHVSPKDASSFVLSKVVDESISSIQIDVHETMDTAFNFVTLPRIMNVTFRSASGSQERVKINLRLINPSLLDQLTFCNVFVELSEVPPLKTQLRCNGLHFMHNSNISYGQFMYVGLSLIPSVEYADDSMARFFQRNRPSVRLAATITAPIAEFSFHESMVSYLDAETGGTITIGEADMPMTTNFQVRGSFKVRLSEGTRVNGVVFSFTETGREVVITGEKTAGTFSCGLTVENGIYATVSSDLEYLPINISGSGSVYIRNRSNPTTRMRAVDIGSDGLILKVEPSTGSIVFDQIVVGGSLRSEGLAISAMEVIVQHGVSASLPGITLLDKLTVGQGSKITFQTGGAISSALSMVMDLKGSTYKSSEIPVTFDFDCTNLGTPHSIDVLNPNNASELRIVCGENLRCSEWRKSLLGSDFWSYCEQFEDKTCLTVSTIGRHGYNRVLLIVYITAAVVATAIAVVVTVIAIQRAKHKTVAVQEEEGSLDDVVEFKDPEQTSSARTTVPSNTTFSDDQGAWNVYDSDI